MNYESKLSWEEVQNLVNEIFSRHFNFQEKIPDYMMLVLKASYDDITYLEAAKGTFYEKNYLNSSIAPKFFGRLSEVLKVKITKHNCIEQLKIYKDTKSNKQDSLPNHISSPPEDTSIPIGTVNILESPEGLVPLDSHFYIERYNVESLCSHIKQPGAQFRIKAPQKMGKTSELERIIAELKKQGYEVVKLSFTPDSLFFSDLYRFTRDFCVRVSKLLRMDNQLDIYWDNTCSCISNVTKYFEEYLLAGRSKPLVLVLDNFDFVFEQPNIANDICGLLRDWHNNLAKQSDECGAIWKKLRLIIVHSTDVYSSLNITDSPLNGVGRVILLEEFNSKQVIELTRRYEFDFAETEIEELMYWFGGHPYLLRLALHHLKSERVSLEKFLQLAPAAAGPFSAYLRYHLGMLQQNRELATAFHKVIESNKPVSIKPIVAFKLESMGLVKTQDYDHWSPSCNLFYQYFLKHLKNFLSD